MVACSTVDAVWGAFQAELAPLGMHLATTEADNTQTLLEFYVNVRNNGLPVTIQQLFEQTPTMNRHPTFAQKQALQKLDRLLPGLALILDPRTLMYTLSWGVAEREIANQAAHPNLSNIIEYVNLAMQLNVPDIPDTATLIIQYLNAAEPPTQQNNVLNHGQEIVLPRVVAFSAAALTNAGMQQ